MGSAQSKTPQIGSLATCRSLALFSMFAFLYVAHTGEKPLFHRARFNLACLMGGDIHQRKPDPAFSATTDRSEALLGCPPRKACDRCSYIHDG